MSHMHEELEVGQHLDQALRSSVTGIAQLMERVSRRRAERDRADAAAERDAARNLGQQYREASAAERDQQRRAEMAARDKVHADKRAMLDERDASRQAYGPWLREGAVERGDRLEASRAWARAAGWVEQDPRARDAEKILRERITDAFGAEPAQILRSVEPGHGNPTGIPAGRISLSEARDLATRYAPHYYGVHTSNSFGRIGKSPVNPTQEKFVDDWQRWAASGSLPHDTLVREWARHSGHSDLLDSARFGTATEQEAALEKVWRDETVTREEQEYEHHKQQLVDAEMSTDAADEAAGVGVQERPDYRPYLDPQVFANADPRVAVQAWESARRDTVANPVDQVAAAARENLEEQFRRRHHASPATYLADAVHDAAVTTTDQRREAEHARAIAEEAADSLDNQINRAEIDIDNIASRFSMSNTNGQHDRLAAALDAKQHELAELKDRKIKSDMPDQRQEGAATADGAVAPAAPGEADSIGLQSGKAAEAGVDGGAQLGDAALKDMDSAGLVLTLEEATKAMPEQAQRQIHTATEDATWLHREQLRANRAGMPRTPYIEHPLRNTIRLTRWGVTDPDVLTASLLHDVAEDADRQIVESRLGAEATSALGPQEVRAGAVDWIADKYGDRVAGLVESVSNPIADGERSRDEQVRDYRQHVSEAIASDPGVLLVKWSDYTDNAASLHHNELNDKTAQRAEKYAQMVPVWREQLAENAAGIDQLTAPGRAAEFSEQLERVSDRLDEIGRQRAASTASGRHSVAAGDPVSIRDGDARQLNAWIRQATDQTPAAAVLRGDGVEDRPVEVVSPTFTQEGESVVRTSSGDSVPAAQLLPPTTKALGYQPEWISDGGDFQADKFLERAAATSPTGQAGLRAASAPAQPVSAAPRGELPGEDRGVAPRKARSPEERDHRSRTWQIAERDFRTGLDPALSPAQAGQAWRDLPEKERYDRYWAAYDTDEARGTSAVSIPPAKDASPRPDIRAGAPEAVSRERVLELNEAAAQWYSGNLQPGTPGHEYLTGRLGEDAVTNGQWRLGYAPGEWTGLANHLRREVGATDQEIVGAGLGRVSSRGNVIDAFRNRAMAAITDTDGSVVGFYGRDLTGEDRNPKHLNTGATPAYTKGEHVFGLHEAAPGARIARAEATFDAIAITEASDGQLQGVAPLGTALTDVQADKIASRIDSDGRVWLALDSDAAGQRQVATDFWKFTERGVDVRELGFPAGADPAQMWQEQPDVMRGLVAYPDVARSASMVVMDSTIAEERVGLLTGDEGARERVDLAEGELASVLRNEFDRGDLNAHVRSELDRLRAQEVQALQQAEHLDQREDQLRDRAVQSLDPNQREQLEGRAERLEDAEQAQRGRAAQLHGQEIASQAHTADVDDAADMPYNRAASSDLSQVSPGAARARAVSAHGFSQSTQEALDTGRTAGKQWQPKRTTGTQQQVGRSRGMRR